MFGQPYNSNPDAFQKYAKDTITNSEIAVTPAISGSLLGLLLVSGATAQEFDAKHHVPGNANLELKYDGKLYKFNRYDRLTDNFVFEEKSAAAVADVSEGDEHIHAFENEGGNVPPKAEIVVEDGDYSDGPFGAEVRGGIVTKGILGPHSIDATNHPDQPALLTHLRSIIADHGPLYKFTPVKTGSGRTAPQTPHAVLDDGSYYLDGDTVNVLGGRVVSLFVGGTRRLIPTPPHKVEIVTALIKDALAEDIDGVIKYTPPSHKNADGGVNWPIGGDGESRVEVGVFPHCG